LIEKDPQFELVCQVSQAKVPIIKCVIDSIHFDLLFAAVDEP
jgi:poly(A) polymerase Pap1